MAKQISLLFFFYSLREPGAWISCIIKSGVIKSVHIISCSMSCLRSALRYQVDFWAFSNIKRSRHCFLLFNLQNIYRDCKLGSTGVFMDVKTMPYQKIKTSKTNRQLESQISESKVFINDIPKYFLYYEDTPLIDNARCMYDTMYINMVLKCL